MLFKVLKPIYINVPDSAIEDVYRSTLRKNGKQWGDAIMAEDVLDFAVQIGWIEDPGPDISIDDRDNPCYLFGFTPADLGLPDQEPAKTS